MPVPANPKIYHIVHADRLPSILNDGFIWCDSEIVRRVPPGTTIGMNNIKQRRLNELTLSSYPQLYVGACTPFYFCPRSIMLYLIYRANPELSYRGGQGPIVHLEVDLGQAVAWADQNNRRWVFTLSNAGAYYFEDRNDLGQLDEIDWDAVHTDRWSGNGISRSVKEGKQAEFLIENSLPWELVSRIGVSSATIHRQVSDTLLTVAHKPSVEIQTNWYY